VSADAATDFTALELDLLLSSFDAFEATDFDVVSAILLHRVRAGARHVIVRRNHHDKLFAGVDLGDAARTR
jgi:hypothetical protein